jgi:hypothetical protein
MALADELAYMTATDLAARIRRRELSPVEVVDAERGGITGEKQAEQRCHGEQQRAHLDGPRDH